MDQPVTSARLTNSWQTSLPNLRGGFQISRTPSPFGSSCLSAPDLLGLQSARLRGSFYLRNPQPLSRDDFSTPHPGVCQHTKPKHLNSSELVKIHVQLGSANSASPLSTPTPRCSPKLITPIDPINKDMCNYLWWSGNNTVIFNSHLCLMMVSVEPQPRLLPTLACL